MTPLPHMMTALSKAITWILVAPIIFYQKFITPYYVGTTS